MPACHAGGHEFESRTHRRNNTKYNKASHRYTGDALFCFLTVNNSIKKEAISLAYKARKSGVKSGERVSPFARQQNLFAFDDGATVSDYTNATIMMLADIVNGAKVTELKKTISIYNDRARDAASGQSDIFSAELKTKEDILKEVNELLNYGTEEAKESALSRADASRRASSESVGAESVEQDGTAGVSRERSADVEDSVQAALTAAEQETNTEPTDAQKEAGNYKKGHVKIDGYNITIENPKGSERSGLDKDGKKWSITMNNTYGYILGTEGVDGDHIDVFLSDNPSEGNVYVVDQVNADGSFDEHKVMYGFPDIESARKAYLSNYEEGWQGLGNITGVSKEEFKKWVDSSHRKTKPFAEYSNVKPLGDIQAKESRETALRDGLIDKLRSAGIEVITDEEEAKRVLDADRERRARLMGSRVEKRKQEIAAKLEGKEMSYEQRTVVNVFTGRNNNLTLNITDKSGKSRSIVMRQGNEQNAGTKHSIYRHYMTDNGHITADDILLVPDVVANGERKPVMRGKTQLYEYMLKDGNGTLYTVLTEKDKGREVFADFYTNRKTSLSARKTRSEEARDIDNNDVSGAKLQKVSDFANYSPVFYSNAEKAVEGISQNKATAEQWLAMIQKQGGLKAGEDKWLGLRDWLTARKGQSLTKEELLDYIRENQVDVDEVSYTANPQGFEDLKREYDGWLRNGGYDYAWEQLRERFGDDADIAFTDFGGELEIDNPEAASALLGSEMAINSIRLDYTTEGLDNKREIALTVPDIDSWNENDEVHFGDAGQGRAVAWVRFGETTDSDGNRVLVIDEIQSKRHQEGREQGYITDEDKTARRLHDEYVKAREMVNNYETVLERKYNVSHISDEMLTEEEAEHRRELWKAVQDARDADRAYNNAHPGNRLAGGIPDAPFEKNWHELAMKRMLRYAAENGFDKVAWTMGEQQAERYNIGGKIERIVKTDDHVYEVYLNNKPMMDLEFDEDGIYRDEGDPALDGKSISDVFGKSLAERLDALPVGERLQEDGLRMGGEGMKGFYDEILPRFMDKYGKKWGIKTVDVTLPYVEESGRTMHSVDVTPEMRESVMEGQPMFLRTDSGEVYGFTKDGKIYIDPRKATAETPVHEFTHLWADGLRKANPKAWEQLKNELEKEKDLFDYVKSLYPELSGDDLMDEVFAHFSGRRGAERLRSEQDKMMQKANGIFDKAKITTMFDKLKNMLHDFWTQARDLFAGKTEGIGKLSAEDFADMALADLIKGEKPLVDGGKEVRYRRYYGGNSGYVGYSKSRRAVLAEERGLRNKSQMDKSFAEEVNIVLSELQPDAKKVTLKEIKDSLDDIRADEWHHTSKYGNRTNYYSADTVAKYFVSETESEKSARLHKEEVSAELSALRSELEEDVFDALSHEEGEYWLENDYARELPQRGSLFVTSNGDKVVVSRNVFVDAKTIDLIPQGENVAMRPYYEWQMENYPRVEHALAEYNAARQAAVESLPSEKVSRLKALDDELTSLQTNEAVRERDDILFRNDDVDDVNERFNEDLNVWEKGDMPSNKYLAVGSPMGILAKFMPSKPIILRRKVLTKALKRHGLAASDIKNLPSALANPIFVFQNNRSTISVLTELQSKDGKNIFVAIELDVTKQMGHELLEVNDMLTVHGRNEENIVKPIIENDSLLWVDKEKGQHWLSSAKSNSQAITKDDLNSAAKIIKEFENPNISEEKFRGGQDVSKDVRSARADIDRAHDVAEEWTEKLNLNDDVQIVDELTREMVDELMPNASEEVKEKALKAKGWFNEKTGKIVIAVGNHRNAEDVMQTILHEGVAHYGLRKLFGENFNTFLDNVYASADASVRKRIDVLQENKGYGRREAVEEYLAGLAEVTDFESVVSRTWWEKVKSLFADMLNSIGLSGFADNSLPLSDNELRYILWRSYDNLKSDNDVFRQAKDIAMQSELKVGNYDESKDATLGELVSGDRQLRDMSDKELDSEYMRLLDVVEKPISCAVASL